MNLSQKTIAENNRVYNLNNDSRAESITKYRKEYREALVANNYEEAFYYLNKNPKLIDIWETESGQTFFIKTVLGRNFEYSSLLLQNYGANIDQVGSQYRTALHFAAEMGDLDLVKYLVISGASTDPISLFGHTPVMLAAIYQHDDIVKYLVNEGKADITHFDGEYLNVLCHAAAGNNFELVEWLINEKEQDVNFIPEDFKDSVIGTKSALIAATLANKFEMVKVLVENYGAKLDLADQYGNNVIQNAILRRNDLNKEIIEYLINKSSPEVLDNQNGNMKTALMQAVEMNDIDLVTLLLRRGCNVNLEDDEGKTALDYSNDEAITKLLIESGAIESSYISDTEFEEDTDMDFSYTEDDVSITGDLDSGDI